LRVKIAKSFSESFTLRATGSSLQEPAKQCGFARSWASNDQFLTASRPENLFDCCAKLFLDFNILHIRNSFPLVCILSVYGRLLEVVWRRIREQRRPTATLLGHRLGLDPLRYLPKNSPCFIASRRRAAVQSPGFDPQRGV
jgi:hypothetical protein